ncbi:MAG: methionyl-tRNA formyltransferase [Thermoleophilaceae bacterium]|jgi:methionyl-tRNA formyltransferase|nr:methionyl-tRNA formyltransferase [Thermoleophilaceae bacterium]
MRTVYLGTSEFAVEVLERLAATPHRPVLAVTRPDRPRGRGRSLQSPPVAARAALLGVETIQPEDVNSEQARQAIAAAEPEAVVICAYGALVKEPLLSAHDMLNVHPSLLPRWRGAAPIERAIEAGDEETGVTIMRPIAELDAGPTCLQRSEPIAPDDNYGSLAGRLAALGGELLVEALDTQPAFREQPDQGVTYADKIEPEDRLLDPARPADQLERRARALTPHIGAYVPLDGGERLGVRRVALAAGVDDIAPGELVERESGLLYGAAQGALQLIEVQPPGKRPMEASAWLRGRAGRGQTLDGR